MPSDALPVSRRYPGISPKAYEHPADRAATAALASIPMLNTVVDKLIEYGFERAVRQELLAGSLRIGPQQLPKVFNHHLEALDVLDLDVRPDLYVTQLPIANAMAIGSAKPMVLLLSGLLALLDEDEQRVVLAHEAGHLLSGHIRYTTALVILVRLGTSFVPPGLAGLPLRAVLIALMEWKRAAELTSDRAAALVTRDPLLVSRTLMTLSAGIKSKELDLDAFLRQAGEYEDWKSGWDKINRFRVELSLTHPYAVRRVSELMKWVRGGDYDAILAGQYRRRDEKTDLREEAAEATDYYAEKFKKTFKEVGDNVGKVGDTVADATGRIADWVRGAPRDADSN